MAADRYVSLAGDNANAGTITRPWRNLTYASNQSQPGDTIFVRGGLYVPEGLSVNRSGTAANRITFKAFPGETPILDGTGASVGGQTSMVEIRNQSYVTLDGFDIRNLTGTQDQQTPLGILITGASIGIEILNCEIYNIRNTSNDGNAHGILAQGTSNTPISDLVIRGNTLRDLVLGNSEALVLNGNVNGFEVSHNSVTDCNNIGIDLIGFEGNGPNGQDQTRNGVCTDNTVLNCSTRNNPAYNAFTAGGIYVDGGRDIIIERNRVGNCDIGIEVASEDPNGSTSNITVRSNFVWNNKIGGIYVGGFNAGRGSAVNCSITGNTLYENDTEEQYSGEILVQFNTSNLDIRNNLFMAGRTRAFVIVNDGNNTGITFDYNVYYSLFATNQNSSEWIWQGNFRSGFNSWKSASGQDANSVYANPQISNLDFTIAEASPARDAGDPSYVPASGEMDGFGNPRISGNRIDAGAHEFLFLSELQQWRLLHFRTADNSGDAADSADPDGDDLSNVLEFALDGQDPTRSDVGAAVAPIAFGINFTRNPNAAAEVNYTIEASPDLENWTPVSSRAAGGAWQTSANLTLSESAGNAALLDMRPALGSRHFYRLKVTVP